MSFMITHISQSAGPVGARVTFTGADIPSTVDVLFNGVLATELYVSPTTVVARVPEHAKSGPITLCAAGEAVKAPGSFTVTASIARLGAARVHRGQTLAIHGSALDRVLHVVFPGGADAAPLTKTPSMLAVKVPAGAETGPLALVTVDGNVETTIVLTVSSDAAEQGKEAMQVGSYEPIMGPVGTQVTILGTDFPSNLFVYFNGTLATRVIVTASAILAEVPDYATTGMLEIQTPGDPPVMVGEFTVTSSIDRFSPMSVSPGDTLSIYGWQLEETIRVAFTGGVSAMPTVKTASLVMVTVPSGASTGLITLQTTYGMVETMTPVIVTSSRDAPRALAENGSPA